MPLYNPPASSSGVHAPPIIVAADGTGDYTTIAAALAVVPAGGATVLVKRGTYTLSASLSVPTKTVLRGEGPGTVIQAPLSTVNAITIAGADVILEDLEIDGRYASQTNSGSQSNQCGVYLSSGAHRLTLRRVYLHDTCGHGVSNVTSCADLAVDACRITNLGVAASQVQAAPAPTTTTFAVAPGTARNFAAGQVLRIGTQAGTILSIQSVVSAVAVGTSTTVFTLNSGDGAAFSNGQVIRVGTASATISTVVGDVVTLTGALANIPVVGQLVSIDTITLTGAITTPSAGDVVAVAGGYLKGVYCTGALRPRVRDSFLSGWSQAIGFWYGCLDGKIVDNDLIANYGYEDTAHTVNRSAIEVYPNTVLGGKSKVSGNVIDGSTHNCIECAQGEVASTFSGNTLRNWASEVGLGATGSALEITGQTGIPGNTTDISVLGNTVLSTGAYASIGVIVNSFTSGIKINSNTFVGFSFPTNPYPITLQGGDGQEVVGNTFRYCTRSVYVNSTAQAGGIISANLIYHPGVPVAAIELAAAGDGWAITGNSIETNNVGGSATGIKIASGNRHRVGFNRIKATTCIHLDSVNDCLVEGNYCEKNISNSKGAIRVAGTSLRAVVRNNPVVNGTNLPTVSIEDTVDYSVVQENQFAASTSATGNITVTSSGTHNVIEPNLTNGVNPTMTLRSLGAKTVNSTQTTIAHGLGYAPTVVNVLMNSAGTVWRSAASDATNVYLTADVDGRTAEVYVR